MNLKHPGSHSVVVLPDLHCPFHDKRALSCAIEAVKFLRPRRVVILGDWLDGAAFSSHGFNSIRDACPPEFLEHEVDPCRVVLDELQRYCSELIFIEGNHENRVERWAANQGARLGPDIFKLISPQSLLSLKADGKKRKNFHWVPYTDRLSHFAITPDLWAIHGWSTASYAAKVHQTRAVSVSIVHGHCIPLTYEVLTGSGWKQLRDVTTADTALCYTTEGMAWSQIQEKVSYTYDGEMAVFDHSRIRMRMTDRHHIYTADGRYIPIRDAIASGVAVSELPASGLPARDWDVFHGKRGVDLSDDQIRLLVAYCADGSKEKDQNSVRWHLKKQRKIDRLTELCARLGEECSWSELSKTSSRKSKGLSREFQLQLIRWAPEKQLPSWLLCMSAAQRAVFLEELPLWDGAELWAHVRQFSSAKPHEIDLVQRIAAMQGVFTSRVSGGRCLTWNTAPEKRSRVATLEDAVTWEHVQDEEVGCITTDHQNFVFRDPGGKVQVSGNTHRYQSYARRDPVSGRILKAWSPGCLCELQASYMNQTPSDWVHGFSIVWVGSDPLDWTDYSVTIKDGRAIMPDGNEILAR